MVSAGVIIAIGLFMVDIVFVSMLFGTWTPIYEITSGTPTVPTRMEYSIWHICFYTKGVIDTCLKLKDEVFDGTDSDYYYDRSQAVIVFLFTCVGISAMIIIMGLLDCCRVLKLEQGAPFVTLVILTFLLLLFTVTTPSIPTNEYVTQKDDFNDINTRNASFYGNIFLRFGDSRIWPQKSRDKFLEDFQNPQLQMKVGWVLIVLWLATPFALISLLLISLSKCSSYREAKKEEKQRLVLDRSSRKENVSLEELRLPSK